MKTWRSWTVKEDRRLEALRMEGIAVAEIARLLDRTVPSVSSRLKGLGVTRPSVLGRYLKFVSLPHTTAEVAKRLGVTPHAIHNAKGRLRGMGISLPPADRPRQHRDAHGRYCREEAGQ